MIGWLPFPLLWLSLIGLWLLLNQTLWIGHVLLGSGLAAVTCLAYRKLQAPRTRNAERGSRLVRERNRPRVRTL